MPRRPTPRVDVQRLGMAVSRPGIDPRTWSSAGRIDDDPDAIRFDATVGWIVDVTFYGSDLEGDSDLGGEPCRVLSHGAGDGFGEYVPPPIGAEVLVEFPGGDCELGPVVAGYLSNEADCKPPSEINGLPIVADAQSSTVTTVSPYDTELKRSPHNRREHYDGDHFDEAARQVIVSAAILLGSETAIEPALLGQTTVANTTELLTALTQLATGLAGLVAPPLAPLVGLGTALLTALQTLNPKIVQQLSAKVKLE